MSFSDGTTTYTLERPVSFSVDGQFQKSRNLILHEPREAHVPFYFRLDQMCARAAMKMAEFAQSVPRPPADTSGEALGQAKDIDEAEFERRAVESAEGIISIIRMSDVDLAKFVEVFGLMACSKECIVAVEDEVRMTSSIWETMRPNDRLGAAAKWCAFFIMPFGGEKPTTSEGPLGSPSNPIVV